MPKQSATQPSNKPAWAQKRKGVHVAVLRNESEKDGSVFFTNQRMTRIEALRSYTIDAAYAGFEETIKGSLTPGKLADITVLSKDILTVPEDQIPSAQVVYTIVGGKVQYARAPSGSVDASSRRARPERGPFTRESKRAETKPTPDAAPDR